MVELMPSIQMVQPVAFFLGTCMSVLAISAALCAQSPAQYPAVQGQTLPQNPASTTHAQNPSANAQAVYLPPGLDIQVRVNESLSSGTAQAGDTFTGTLVNSLVDDNNNIIFANRLSNTASPVIQGTT